MIRALNEEFVPVLLDSLTPSRATERYTPTWTPTLLLLDQDSTPHYRFEGFLPPQEYLVMLRVARAVRALHVKDYEAMGKDLDYVLEHYPQSAFRPEALYWVSIARLRTGSRDGALAAWDQLKREYPGNIWTIRLPR